MTISGWFSNSVRYWHRDIATGIKNLIIWFPTIWTDRNWDYVFLLGIIRKKLLNDAKYHRECGISEDADLYAKEMEFCVRCIDRITNDVHWNDYYQKHKHLPREGFLELFREFDEPEFKQERDKKLLFRVIEKNINGWWD